MPTRFCFKMLWIMRKILFLAFFTLGACGPYTPYMTAVGLGTLVATDKSVTDHAVSHSLDEDCSIIRWSQGGNYCQANETPPTPQQLYCYRSLGENVCYDKPDEDASEQTRVYHPTEQNTTK